MGLGFEFGPDDIFTTEYPGNVPAPGSVLGKFLRDDGTWQDAAITDASLLTSGTLDDARLSANVPIMTAGVLPAVDGSLLTNLTGADIAPNGDIPDAALSVDVTLQGNAFNDGGLLAQFDSDGFIVLPNAGINAEGGLKAHNGAPLLTTNAGNGLLLGDTRVSPAAQIFQTQSGLILDLLGPLMYGQDSLALGGATVNDWAPTAGALLKFVTPFSGGSNITGIIYNSNFAGTVFQIINLDDTDNIIFKHENAGTATTSRRIRTTTGNDVILYPREMAYLFYDTISVNPRWCVFKLEDGTHLDGANLLTSSVADAALSSNVTLLGNTFNGVSQLVQLDGAGKLPALDGSALTNLPSGTGQLKAFIKFSVAASGGAITVESSFNVTSVVRNDAGDFTINFTSAFADTAYGVLISGRLRAGASFVGMEQHDAPVHTTSAVKIYTLNGSSSFSPTDPAVCSVAAFR